MKVQHMIITIHQRTNLKKSWSSQMMEQSGLATRSCSGELHDIVPGDERRSRTIKYFLRFTFFLFYESNKDVYLRHRFTGFPFCLMMKM